MSIEEDVKDRARGYLRTRGTEATPAAIHERVTAAFIALETFLDTVGPAEATQCGPPGEWTIQEIVDHLVETHRPGLDELRCLLAGRRPPGPPIPAGLQSKAPLLRPWPWLRAELQRVHRAILEALAAVPPETPTAARAPVIMVVNVPFPEGVRPVHWVEEVDWKAYAIVWRPHALDHLKQAKKVMASWARA